MKKLLILCFAIFIITGCSLTNGVTSPTSKADEFFSKYQTLDEKVLGQLDTVLANQGTMTEGQKSKYQDLMKKQYQNLEYTIKDETVDGDHAVVVAEIQVIDYSKAIGKADNYLTENPTKFNASDGKYDQKKFMDYKIDLMEQETTKVKYTLNLIFNKKEDEWVLEELTDTEKQKIHGVFNRS